MFPCNLEALFIFEEKFNMPNFKNLNELRKHLQQKIDKTLISKVADTIREAEHKNIDETVYDAYDPHVYQRRGDNGGIGDMRNMKAELVEDGKLIVTNETKPNDNYNHSMPSSAPLAEVIEFGHGYNGYQYDYPPSNETPCGQPRPFIKNTYEELKNTGNHVDALKKGLRKQGILTK